MSKTLKQLSRKDVIRKVSAILEAVHRNPGINATEICEEVGFAATGYLQDLEELDILHKQREKLPSGPMCNRYYNKKFSIKS